MMKIILRISIRWWIFAFLPVGTILPSYAQSTIYQESFDNLVSSTPPGWSQAGIGWYPADSLPIVSGPALAGCDPAGSYVRYHSSGLTSGQSGELISPVLNLSSFSGKQVELEFCLNNPGVVIGEGDGVSLFVSADSGSSWTLQLTDTSYYGTWTTLTLSLQDSFLTSGFRFKFRGLGTQALIDVGIDHIRLIDVLPPCLADTSTVSVTVPPFVCKDQFADQLLLSTSNQGGSSYQYILTDAQDRLIQLIQGTSFDANSLPPDNYRVYGVSFDGALIAPVNIQVSSVTATGCAILSANFVEFQVVLLEGNITVNSNYNGFAVSTSGNNDGIASVSLSGGGGAYAYYWQGDPGNNSPISQNLSAGLQVVTVSDSLTGCTFSDSIFLQEPQPLEASLVTTSDYNGAAISCPNISDGSLGLSLSGGVPPYTIQWSHDQGNDSLSAGNLVAGQYAVLISDLNGAVTADSVLLVEPDQLEIDVLTIKAACEGIQDGLIQLGQRGGTGQGQWRWDHGPSGNFLSGLAPGSYIATVTDENGCQQTDSLLIEQAIHPLVIPEITQPSCFGSSDARIDLQVLAGQMPVIHTWLSGDTGAVRTELIPGNYQVLSTDANGCRDTNQMRINSPAPLRSFVSSNPDGGSGTGSAVISIEGGQGPYRADWPTGDTTLMAEGLMAGTYLIPVQDALGCETEVAVEVELALTPDCLADDLGFSPNGDGINDQWEIPCISQYQNLEIQVLNRWGQRVYYALNYDRPWDGRSRGADLPNGTYYYVIRFINNGRPAEFKGTLSIVR